MKRIKLGLLLVLSFLVLSGHADAASGSISISGSSTAVVGNQVTVTVTISSNTAMAGWEFDVDYNSSFLKLSSSTAPNGGATVIDYTTKTSGVKSKSYTFKFKALKSGNATVSIGGYDVVAMNESSMSMSRGSKSIKLMTQAELEATYSTNANIKGLTVSAGTLTPAFSPAVKEYEVEVPNEVEKITIGAQKEDATASVSGAGEKELLEGNNKYTITITAQKGNTNTYTINVYRKELNPIKVKVDNKDYTIIRRAEDLIMFTGFEATTIEYEGEEIPALFNELTNTTIIGVKDEDGKAYMYIYDGKITHQYFEIKGVANTIFPLELKSNKMFEHYIKKRITIDGVKIEAYLLNKNSENVIIYGINIDTGEEGYYIYNLKDKATMKFTTEYDDFYKQQLTLLKKVIAGLIGLSALLFIILLIIKPSKKKMKKIENKIKEKILNPIKENIEEKKTK